MRVRRALASGIRLTKMAHPCTTGELAALSCVAVALCWGRLAILSGKRWHGFCSSTFLIHFAAQDFQRVLAA
jgi:hypothetical protein